MQPIQYDQKITLLADPKMCGVPTTVTMVGLGYKRTLSLETTNSRAALRSLRSRSHGWAKETVDGKIQSKSALIDPFIGMVIRFHEGFVDETRKGHSEDFNSSCVDVPLSLSTSGRHVRERSSSMTMLKEAMPEELHALVQRDSMVSLPTASLRLEDRFAGRSPSSKTDKMIRVPIKSFDRMPASQPLAGAGEVPFPSLPALPRPSRV